MHSSLFDALVTVERYYEDSSNIIASITPAFIHRSLRAAAEHKGLKEHLLFLIGGEGIGYSYKEDIDLIKVIKKLHKTTNLPITIVTSRKVILR